MITEKEKDKELTPLQQVLKKVEEYEIVYSYDNRGSFPSGMLLKGSVILLLEELEVALTKNQR